MTTIRAKKFIENLSGGLELTLVDAQWWGKN